MLEHERRVTGYRPSESQRDTGDTQPETFPNVANYLERDDPSLALYREPVTRDAVIDFFVDIVGNESVVVSVLDHAERHGITPTQAFALAFIESSYRPDSVNHNPNSDTTDRGLFQLNDRTFSYLSTDDFFHPDTNASYAMRYLRYTIDRADGDYSTGIAIYNAGPRRVLAGETPDSTKVYVERATAYREQLLDRFRAYIRRQFPTESGDDTRG